MPNTVALLVDAVDNDAAYSGESAARNVIAVYFSGAVADGDLVEVDLTDTTYGMGASFKRSAANDDNPLVIGVADETVAAGGIGRVVTYGVKVDANVKSGGAAGAVLQSSGVAGRAEAGGTSSNAGAIGVILTAASGNKATVFMYRR